MWRRKSIASQFVREMATRIFQPSTTLLPGLDPIRTSARPASHKRTVTNDPEQTGSSQSKVLHGDHRVMWLCLLSLAVSLAQTARIAASSPRPAGHTSLGLFA